MAARRRHRRWRSMKAAVRRRRRPLVVAGGHIISSDRPSAVKWSAAEAFLSLRRHVMRCRHAHLDSSPFTPIEMKNASIIEQSRRAILALATSRRLDFLSTRRGRWPHAIVASTPSAPGLKARRPASSRPPMMLAPIMTLIRDYIFRRHHGQASIRSRAQGQA